MRSTNPKRNLALISLAIALGGLSATLVAAIGAPSAGGADPGLKRFGSCGPLRDYLREHRHQLRYPAIADDLFVDGERGAALDTGGEGAAATPAPTAPGSPTNVQEAGVDEPDLVKTDGETIFAVAGGELKAVDAGGDAPALLGSLDLPAAFAQGPFADDLNLLLSGETALVIGTSYTEQTRTLLAEIDIADPAAMRVVRTMAVDGAFVNARQTASTARVVVSALPEVPIAARGHGRAWMPGAVVRDRGAGERTRMPLLDCSQVTRAKRFSGVGMLTVLTIDIARGLPAIDTQAVMSSGEVVYGSPTSLYVATQRSVGDGAPAGRISDVTTEIHQFDVSDPGSTRYVASGRVEGFMLNQWSMSEHEGLLRVASTTSPPWEGGGFERSSESFVTVLARDGDRLTEVGRVGGLGEGERIYAVRLIGDTGYVVTYREVDPLYVVDLSDPGNPALLGELKVPGYSAYLHPVGDRFLLGVGQDADADGATTGVQVSLFDVSDPGDPTRLDVESFGGGSWSEVESDHHAFFHSADHELALIPLESYSAHGYLRGAAGLRVDPEAADPLGRIARVSHGDSYRAQIRRTVAIGDRVFTFSEKGIAAHDAATLAEQAFVGL